MKLYSFQPLKVWQELEKNKYYCPKNIFETEEFFLQEKKEKINLNYQWGFIDSYQWLAKQMIVKNVLKSIRNKNNHIIWSWYQWYGCNKKQPDKRFSSVYNFYEEPFVMLELEIEDNRVLLSDYEAWHYVLNYWYLNNERKTEDFVKKYDFYKEKPLNNKKAHDFLINSWQQIFDIKSITKTLQYSKEQQAIQATFFDLYLSDVKMVHFFENKKCYKIIDF